MSMVYQLGEYKSENELRARLKGIDRQRDDAQRELSQLKHQLNIGDVIALADKIARLVGYIYELALERDLIEVELSWLTGQPVGRHHVVSIDQVM